MYTVVSEEATVDQSYKERLLQATETGTLFSGCSTGARAPRAESCATARSRCRKRRGGPESGLRSGEGEVIAKGANGEPVKRYSAIDPYTDVTGDTEGLRNWTGQGVGLVNRIQSAADIVKAIAEEAVQVMRSANDLIRE